MDRFREFLRIIVEAEAEIFGFTQFRKPSVFDRSVCHVVDENRRNLGRLRLLIDSLNGRAEPFPVAE